MQLTDPQKIAIVDALLANMQGKRKTVTHRREPSYQWTISSSKHCDLASTLLAMVPEQIEERPWPKWKTQKRVTITQTFTYDYGYPLLDGLGAGKEHSNMICDSTEGSRLLV